MSAQLISFSFCPLKSHLSITSGEMVTLQCECRHPENTSLLQQNDLIFRIVCQRQSKIECFRIVGFNYSLKQKTFESHRNTNIKCLTIQIQIGMFSHCGYEARNNSLILPSFQWPAVTFCFFWLHLMHANQLVLLQQRLLYVPDCCCVHVYRAI